MTSPAKILVSKLQFITTTFRSWDKVKNSHLPFLLGYVPCGSESCSGRIYATCKPCAILRKTQDGEQKRTINRTAQTSRRSRPGAGVCPLHLMTGLAGLARLADGNFLSLAKSGNGFWVRNSFIINSEIKILRHRRPPAIRRAGIRLRQKNSRFKILNSRLHCKI